MKFDPKPLKSSGMFLEIIGLMICLGGVYCHYFSNIIRPQLDVTEIGIIACDFFYLFFGISLFVPGFIMWSIGECFKEK